MKLNITCPRLRSNREEPNLFLLPVSETFILLQNCSSHTGDNWAEGVKKQNAGNSLAIPWFRSRCFHSCSRSSVPGRGTNIPQEIRLKKKCLKGKIYIDGSTLLLKL